VGITAGMYLGKVMPRGIKTPEGEQKLCTKCMIKKDIDEFLQRKDSIGTTSWCTDCRAKLRRQQKDDFYAKMSSIKLAKGCIECGFNDHPEALDFDHLPQFEKKFELSKGWGHSWTSVLEELLKCEVVCANHHRIRSYNRRTENGGN
jgi:hypothetical protein